MASVSVRARRVQWVLINGEPLDPERTYTVSGSKYLLLGHGDGHSAFDGCREPAHDYTEDAEAFIRYLSQELHGEIPADYADRYGSGRITIVP